METGIGVSLSLFICEHIILQDRLSLFCFTNPSAFGHNLRPWWNLFILGDDHHAIADEPFFAVEIELAREGADDHAFPDTHILVNDGSFDITTRPNAGGNG